MLNESLPDGQCFQYKIFTAVMIVGTIIAKDVITFDVRGDLLNA